MPHSRVLAASLLFLLLAAPPLMAADTYWSGNGSSDNFSDLGNWFDNGFGQFNPNPGNNINFNNSLGAPHTWAFDDYGVNGWFGNIISYNNAGYIKVYGGTTYCYKFENNNNGSLFEAAADLSNRTGPDTDLQINPVGSGGIAVSNVVMQDGMQLKVYGGNTLTVNGVISETGSPAGATLAILQGATVVLNQAATFTGDTYANSGTLRLATNSALANVGNYLRLGDTANTLSANLNLDGGLILATPINVRSGNSGTMTIANTASTAGAATYSGNVYLDHDVTVYANTGGGNVLSGAAIDLKNQTLTVDGPGTNFISGVLTNSTGTGALTKNSTGLLTLTGVNNYNGGTTLANGAISINNGSALGTGALTITELLSGTTGTLLTVANSGAVTLSNNIVLPNATTANSIYALTKSATGRLVLAGTISGGGSGLQLSTRSTSGDKLTVYEYAGTNTFAGGVQLWQGSVQVDNPASLGVGTVYMDANNSPIGDLSFANNTMTFTNPLVLQSAATISNANSVTLSGPISGSGIPLVKYGTGILSLSGANSYNNTATIYAGTLRTLVTGTLPTASTVGFGGTNTSPQTLDLQGTAQTVANLAFGTGGSNSVIITGITGSALSVSPATLTFAPNATSNSLAVNMTGLGSFIYTNNIGTIQANNGSVLMSSSTGQNIVTLAQTNFITATNLSVGNASPSSGVINSTIKLGQNNTVSASSINLGGGRAGGTIQFAGGLTSPTLTIAGVPGGAATAAVAFGSHDSFQASDTPVSLFDVTAGTLTAQLSSLTIGRVSPNANSTGRGISVVDSFKMGAGTLTASSLTMGTVNNSANVTNYTINVTSLFSITNGGTATIPTLTLVNNALTNTAGTANTIALTNTVALTNGATLFATSILQGPTNSFATINNQIAWGDGTVTNIAGAGLAITNVNIALNGAATIHNLGIASGQSGSVGAVISGIGALNLTGLGSETLFGANSYSGSTTIGGGTLTLAGAGSLGAGTYAGLITNNGSLVHNSSASVALNGIISGTGSVTKQTGAGELTLAGANTYSGGTTLAGATTRVKSSNTALGSGLVTVTGNATLATQSGSTAVALANPVSLNSGVTLSIDSGYASLTFNGPVTNSGNFATTSSGTTTLNGTNTYSGTTVDGASAVLTIGGTGSLGGGFYANTITIGNMVNFNSTVPQTLGGGISGAGAGGLNVGAGTLTLTNVNNYTAPTFINAGTLALTGVGSIALSPRISLASGGVFDVSGLASVFTLGSSQTLTGGRASSPATDINGNYTSAGTNNIAGSGTNGTLTVNGNLSLTGGALIYDLFTPAAADLITLNGAGRTLSLSSTTVITPASGSVTNGTYTLINGIASIPSGGAANLVLAASATNTMRNLAATFAAVAPTVTMTLTAGGTNLLWQGTSSGAWDINTTANWTNFPGGTTDKFFNQDRVVFSDTALPTASGTNVTISTSVYPASVAFSNTSRVFALGGSGSISGVGNLTKAGTALVTISNANSYTGGTTISAGTLRLATNNPNGLGLGPLTMTGGTLDVNSNNLSILSLSGTGGTITNSYVTGVSITRTLTVNQLAASNNFAGLIKAGSGTTTNDFAFVKNGSGILTLSGANTYGGATTVNAGTLEVLAKATSDTTYTVAQGATLKYGYSTVAQAGYSPALTINGNGIGNTNSLQILAGKTLSANSGMTIQTAPTTIVAYGGGNATIRGWDVNNAFFIYTVAAASGSVVETNVNVSTGTYGYKVQTDVGANTATGDLTIKGVVSGTGSAQVSGEAIATGLDKRGAGSLFISAAGTYSSGTSINGGNITLSGGDNRLPAATTLALGNGSASGQLILVGVNQTIGGLLSNGTGTTNAVLGGSITPSTLTINTAATNTFTGAIGGTGANQNNVALVKSGLGQAVLSGKLTYSGNTTVSAGSLVVSSLTNLDGGTLSVADAAGTIAATNLTLGTSAGSTVAITGFSSATSAPIVATNLVANGVTTISLAGSFTSGQFPLIQFTSGTIGGTGSFTVQQAGLPRGVTAAVVTNVPNSSIDVVLTAYPLVWVGATNGVNVATWDNGTTTNWSLIGTPNYFTNNDNVQIDDTATGSTTLNLTATLNPFAVLVTNNVNNYAISATAGSALTGGMGLTKQGTGLLTITASNSFTGGVTISGGAVNIQNGYAFNNNTVTVNSGTELELQGGISVPAVTALTLKSTGTNSTTGGLRSLSGDNTFGGPITLSAASRINSDSGNLTLTNGVTAGTRSLTLGGNGNIIVSTTTISGSAGLSKWGTGTNIWNLNPNISSGGVTVNNGTLQINNGNFGGTFTPLITVNSGAVLWGNGTHSTGGGASLVVNQGTWLMSGEDYKQSLTMVDGLIGPGPNPVSAGAELRVGSSGGAGSWIWYVTNSVVGSVINSKLNTIGSGINLTLNVARGAAASDLTVNGLISNGGTITLAGNGITTISCPSNNYTGTTTVTGGTLLLIGSLGSSAVTVAPLTNTITTLAGTGVINGAAVIQFGGTVQPGIGGTNTSSLAVSNTLTMAGNALFVLNRTNAQNSSRIIGITTATCGGTLSVTNVGDPLQVGDTFTLFQAASYTGGFTNVVLPALVSPLVWNTNNLVVNGSIVVSKAPTAVILTSSENPSGFNDSITFTANVTPGVATGSIGFQTNGVLFDTEPLISGSATSAAISSLPRGTNVITAVYSGDSGYLGSLASLNQVVTNHPPAVTAMTVTRAAGVSVHIALSDVATNWSDVDTDTLTLAAINLTTTNGMTLMTNSTLILYPNGPSVADQISYTISDGQGGTNTGYINIVMIISGVTGTNSIANISIGGSTNAVTAYGIPGYSYILERATNLVPAIWVDVSTNTAATNGVINAMDSFDDLGSVPPGSAYYRLKWQP